MRQEAFVKHRAKSWKAFEEMLTAANPNLNIDFPSQYRSICTDLSTARSRNYSPVLVEKLNALVKLGQRNFYKNERGGLSRIITAVSVDFPQALYINRYAVWFSFALFFGLGFVFMGAVILQPDWIYALIDASSVEDIENMYATSVHKDSRGRDDDIFMFGIYIYNNIGIAFQTFAGGVLFGIGSLFFLIYNGVFLGAIQGHIINAGYSENFFSFIIGHGSFELTAIAIAGAAGWTLGFSLLKPRCLTRLQALQQAAKRALPLIVGAFVMLVIAAGLEAFWSPRDIDPMIKYAVGAVLWSWVLYRLGRGTYNGT